MESLLYCNYCYKTFDDALAAPVQPIVEDN